MGFSCQLESIMGKTKFNKHFIACWLGLLNGVKAYQENLLD